MDINVPYTPGDTFSQWDGYPKKPFEFWVESSGGCMNWKRFTAFTFTLLAVLLLSYQPAQAQSNVQAGSIQGVVTDPQGGVVPNAKVTITNKDTGAAIETTTSSAGTYTSGSLTPASYTVRVEAPSFKTTEVTMPVLVNVVTSVNVKLELGASSTVVEVNGQSVTVNTDQAQVSGSLTTQQIENLPVNGRNFLDLANLPTEALLMTHLHAMFRSLANVGSGSRTDSGLDLEKLLGTANRVFCESTFAGQYATLVCGRAGKSGDIEIASAGHLPAVMVTRDGVKQIHATGLPLGMFSTSPYSVQRARMEPGDSLLLYTDGISEARNPTGTEYGMKRLASVAGERHGWVPQELLAACMRDIAGYSSGIKQVDDQTLMVIHRSDTAGISLND
jgi:hypothetical protein